MLMLSGSTDMSLLGAEPSESTHKRLAETHRTVRTNAPKELTEDERAAALAASEAVQRRSAELGKAKRKRDEEGGSAQDLYRVQARLKYSEGAAAKKEFERRRAEYFANGMRDDDDDDDESGPSSSVTPLSESARADDAQRSSSRGSASASSDDPSAAGKIDDPSTLSAPPTTTTSSSADPELSADEPSTTKDVKTAIRAFWSTMLLPPTEVLSMHDAFKTLVQVLEARGDEDDDDDDEDWGGDDDDDEDDEDALAADEAMLEAADDAMNEATDDTMDEATDDTRHAEAGPSQERQ